MTNKNEEPKKKGKPAILLGHATTKNGSNRSAKRSIPEVMAGVYDDAEPEEIYMLVYEIHEEGEHEDAGSDD